MGTSRKSFVVAASFTAVCAIAASCGRRHSDRPATEPPAPRISVDVFCTVSFDPGAHEYIYEYSLLNGPNSQGVVDFFGLRRVGAHDSVQVPRGWMSTEGEYEGEPRSVTWAAIGYGDELAGDLDFMRYPPPNAIFAGESGPVFRLRSRETAETTGCVAEPFVSPVIESEDEEPGPFTYIPSVWETSLIGTVYAPRVPATSRPADARRAVPAWAAADSARVRVSFILARRGHVNLDVIDASGAKVAVLLDRWMGPGCGVAVWDRTDQRGRAAQNGTYFTRMRLDGMNLGRHPVAIAR